MKLRKAIISAAMGAFSLCCAATASFANSQSQPGLIAGVITGAPLPDGIYSIQDYNWGRRGPWNGEPGVDIGVASPIHIVAFLPYRLLEGHPFFAVESVWAQVNVGGGYGHTIANLTGFAAQKIEAGLSWTLGGGLDVSVRTGVWVPVNSEVSLRDFWISQTNLAVAYINNGWVFNADLGYGTGKNGNYRNVAPANVAFGQPATAGNAYGVLNLTALKHIEKWEIGAVGFGSNDLTSPYTGYLKQSQFALGGLIGYDFGPVKANIRLTRDVYQQNEGGYETRLWAHLLIPIWVFDKPATVEAKY
jgi:hypothetical protein